MSDQSYPLVSQPNGSSCLAPARFSQGDALATLLENLHEKTLYKSQRRKNSEYYIRASNDYEAVLCWLNEYKATPTTYVAYQKESERLLLWCVYQARKSLSQCDRADFEAYFEFLVNPTPHDFWCTGKRQRYPKRFESGWKPFINGLNTASHNLSIAAARSLTRYLHASNFWENDPLSLIRRKKAPSHQAREIQLLERILEPDEFQALLKTVLEMPEDSQRQLDEKERTRFIIAAFYFLGTRGIELSQSHWGQFRRFQNKWWFITLGKGNKIRRIPVVEFLNDIIRFRAHLQLPSLPKPDEIGSLVPSWQPNKRGLNYRQIYRIIKKVAVKTSERFKEEPHKQAKFIKLSPHWLRHQSGTEQLRAGVNPIYVKDNFGHSKMDTTLIYLHAIGDDKHNDMRKHTLWDKISAENIY